MRLNVYTSDHSRKAPDMKSIGLKEARASFSAIVDQAFAGEPVAITRHGRADVVLLSYEEYARLSNVPSFGDILAAFPAEADDIPVRNRKTSRSYRQEF